MTPEPPVVVLIHYFNERDPKLEDAANTWTLFPESVEMIAYQEVKIALKERIHLPEGKPCPLGSSEKVYAAIRVVRGGQVWRMIGVPVGQKGRIAGARRQEVTTEFLQCSPRPFPFRRRWEAGFWPWERDYMDGEANKVWEAIEAMEAEQSAMKCALESLRDTQREMLDLLRERKKKLEAKRARPLLRLCGMPLSPSTAEETKPLMVLLDDPVNPVYYAWDSTAMDWQEVSLRVSGPEQDDDDGDEEEDYGEE